MSIAEFFAWWGGQLRTLLPAGLAAAAPLDRDAVLVALDGPVAAVGDDGSAGPMLVDGPAEAGPMAVEVSLRRRGQASGLGRFVLDAEGVRALAQAAGMAGRPAPVILRLGAGFLLEKRLALPLAAERELDRVLGFEMDRETPFGADEVYWDASVEERDRRQGRLAVRLSLVPRAPLAGLFAALEAAGLAPSILAPDLPGGGARPIALDHAGARGSGWRGRTLTLAAGAVAVLALVAIAVPFVRQATALAGFDAQVAALQPQVDEAARLRRQISGGGGEAVAAERTRLGDPLQVLAAATKALPDDTHLTDLTLKNHKLSLIGQSAAAAALLGALAAEPGFKDPAFAAPVTKLEANRQEIFSITAEVRP